jgi:pimeloyl-ACP methyl ester carboxylesterase
MRFKLICLLCFLSQFSVAVNASDIEREKRLASEIVDSIMDGDAEFLNADGHEFLAIYTEADEPRGGVVIMHGRGYHPDWSDVANPLRVGLAENGWNTLSIQMPVLDKEARFYDYLEIMEEAGPRIEAAIDFLQDQGNEKIVLIAHSCSVHMTMDWIDRGLMHDVDAFVGIGMGAVDYQQPMKRPFPLDKMQVPVLDVYGEDEFPAVLRSAPERLAMMRKAGNPKSKQMTVPNANHYFTDQGEALLEAITPWLQDL